MARIFQGTPARRLAPWAFGAAALSLVAACVGSALHGEGGSCNRASDCESGLVCAAGFCAPSVADGGVDAALPDAAPGDATAEASTADAGPSIDATTDAALVDAAPSTWCHGGSAPCVFVTSATFSANFAQGAVDAQVVADAKCADAVATASRQYPGAFHGKWLAWLTTSTAAASIHVPGVAGGTFFEWSLVGRAWTSTPHVFDADLKLAGNEVLSRSELGEELPIVDVWTGSPQGGNVYETDTCHDWTSLGNLSGTIQGTIGQTHQMAGLWTNYTTVGCGSNPKHLYCFQVEK